MLILPRIVSNMKLAGARGSNASARATSVLVAQPGSTANVIHSIVHAMQVVHMAHACDIAARLHCSVDRTTVPAGAEPVCDAQGTLSQSFHTTSVIDLCTTWCRPVTCTSGCCCASCRASGRSARMNHGCSKGFVIGARFDHRRLRRGRRRPQLTELPPVSTQ